MRGLAPQSLARLGLLTGAALILFVVEGLVPRPLPWMKLGLANTAVLLALLVFGFGAALAVNGVKLLVGSFLAGTVLGPAFFIGGGAGLASLLVMAGVRRVHPTIFSPIGLSVLGAVVHQAVQLLLAHFYIRQAGLFALLPVFLLGGLVSGALIGLLVHWILARLQKMGWLEIKS